MAEQENLLIQKDENHVPVEQPYYAQEAGAYPGTVGRQAPMVAEPCQSDKQSLSRQNTQLIYDEPCHNEKADFIRKVYGIILYMFAIVGILSFPAMYLDNYRSWLMDNPLMLILWFCMFIGSMIGLFCQHRHVPWNYFWCSMVAGSMGMVVSHFIAMTDPVIVFIAVLLTVGMTLVITLSAMSTKEPSEGCLRMFFIVLVTSIITMILLIFLAPIPALHSFFCTLYILIYGLYLWIDTWLIVNEGVHNCDTYMLAAFFVFVDIIMIFLYLLLLLGGGKK